MKDTDHLLVVAERAADPGRLVDMLGRRAEAAPMTVTLLVPATLYGIDWAGDPRASIVDAARYAELLRRTLEMEGVDVARTLVGDPDPRAAIEDVLGTDSFAEVLISRPPRRLARLIRMDLPNRVAQATDAPVTYVSSPRLMPKPRRGRHGLKFRPSPFAFPHRS
jgi:hypothetical protein